MKSLKRYWYWFALPAAALLLVPLACAQERPIAPAIVTRTCSGCHGMDGQAQLPYIPRLAGLSAAYSEHKLANYRAAASWPVDEAFSRVANIGSARKDAGITSAATAHMVGMARSVSGEDRTAAAQWYAAQMPARGSSGNRKLIEEGRALFMEGAESQGIPACQSCHGSEAQGSDIAPRLAGQNAAYVIGQMALFRSGDRRQSPDMAAVSQHVQPDQARAIATYLQSR